MGILYGVGVGPGNPEDLTLKAVRIIKECDVLILPTKSMEDCYAYKIVEEVVPEIKEKEIRCFHFPMTKDKMELDKAHNMIYEEIHRLLNMGKNLVFLTIGDPCIYSTYNYIHSRVRENGGEAVIINGVTSFCAVAARIGVELGKGDEEIHIIPGNKDISGTLELSGTKVYMKSGRKIKNLISYFEENNVENTSKVYAVANCGMENEKVYMNIDDLKNVEKDYLVTVIVKEII